MITILSFHQRLLLSLCLLLTISFALQLIAVLSAPLTKNITLSTYNGYKFGVFGFCKDSYCTDIGIGYKSEDLLPGFALPSNARHSISQLLVVHPLSTAFTFVEIVLSTLLFFGKFNSSAKLQLLTLFWMLPTFLLCLLSFLVDMLLFIPHLEWPSWALLASTVFLAFCGTMLCVMRRTVSSRRYMRRNYTQLGDEEYYSLAAYKSNNEDGNGDDNTEDFSIDSNDVDALLISTSNESTVPNHWGAGTSQFNNDNEEEEEEENEREIEDDNIITVSSHDYSANPTRAYMNSKNQTSQAAYFPPKVMALPVESIYHRDDEQE